MPSAVYSQLISLTAGTLLLSSVLLVWRHSLRASIRLLAFQGVALAVLVAVLGLAEGDVALGGTALLVLSLKGVLLPIVLTRGSQLAGRRQHEDALRTHPTSALIGVSLLTTLAYLVSGPMAALGKGAAARAVPIGLAMVLIGFQLLVTRRRALSQLVGFLLLDNGIATVAFLTAGGVPLVVELGASLDVVLVVLILRVLSARMERTHGNTDLDELRELRD
jgi:hydrogenase-4 component E